MEAEFQHFLSQACQADCGSSGFGVSSCLIAAMEDIALEGFPGRIH
jgi:hypothetical protein